MGASPLSHVHRFTRVSKLYREGNHNEGSCLSKKDL
jgi:hypothetical protein